MHSIDENFITLRVIMYCQNYSSQMAMSYTSAARYFNRCALWALVGLALPAAVVSGQMTSPATSRQPEETVAAQATPALSVGDATITQSQAAALLEEMRRLELLLSARTMSPVSPKGAAEASVSDADHPVTLHLRAADHALGDASAPVVMVEFADLQCPFCKDFQKSTFPDLYSDYIKTGSVRFVVRDLPLANHPYAKTAAEAIRCAGEQGRYWELRNALLIEQRPPSAETITAVATGMHLKMAEFGRCQDRHTFSPDIESEESEAEGLGINGTPTFLIGQPVDGEIRGFLLNGDRSIGVYRGEIERILRATTKHAASIPESSTTIRASINQIH